MKNLYINSSLAFVFAFFVTTLLHEGGHLISRPLPVVTATSSFIVMNTYGIAIKQNFPVTPSVTLTRKISKMLIFLTLTGITINRLLASGIV